MSNGVFQLHLEIESNGVRIVRLYTIDENGQMSLLGDHEFGPFATSLEVGQWLTRALTLAIRRATT